VSVKRAAFGQAQQSCHTWCGWPASVALFLRISRQRSAYNRWDRRAGLEFRTAALKPGKAKL